MSRLTIVAHIHANPDQVELVKAEPEKLIPITRAEPGCIQYDLHQDNENPAHFLFHETSLSSLTTPTNRTFRPIRRRNEP